MKRYIITARTPSDRLVFLGRDKNMASKPWWANRLNQALVMSGRYAHKTRKELRNEYLYDSTEIVEVGSPQYARLIMDELA